MRVLDAAQLRSEELRFLVHPRALGYSAASLLGPACSPVRNSAVTFPIIGLPRSGRERQLLRAVLSNPSITLVVPELLNAHHMHSRRQRPARAGWNRVTIRDTAHRMTMVRRTPWSSMALALCWPLM